MNLNGIIDFIKLKPKYYFIFSIVSGVILFIPDEWRLGMDIELKGIYKTCLFIAFVLFLVMWVYAVGEFIFLNLKRKSKGKNKKRSAKSDLIIKLTQLSKKELDILSQFYAEGTKVMKLDVFDPIVNGMCSDGILEIVFIPGTNSYLVDIKGTPVKINENVRECISFEISNVQKGYNGINYQYSFAIIQ